MEEVPRRRGDDIILIFKSECPARFPPNRETDWRGCGQVFGAFVTKHKCYCCLCCVRVSARAVVVVVVVVVVAVKTMPPPKVFGQTMRKQGASRYQRQFGNNNNKHNTMYRSSGQHDNEAADRRHRKEAAAVQVEKAFGMERFGLTTSMEEIATTGDARGRRGWLYNVLPTTVCVTCLCVFDE